MSLFNLNPKESPNELFEREKELEELIRLIKARRWIAILGPRMVGKTSLLKVANTKLEKAKIKTVYANLWGAKATNGLLKALARGLNDEKSLLQKIKDAAKRIEGVSIVSGGIAISVSKKPMATSVFNASLRDGRLTPNSLMSSLSGGRRSPGFSFPSLIMVFT